MDVSFIKHQEIFMVKKSDHLIQPFPANDAVKIEIDHIKTQPRGDVKVIYIYI